MTSSIYKIKDILHNHGTIESITVNTPGSDYTTAPITITGDGTDATAEAVIQGAVQDIIVTDRGNNGHPISSTTATVNRNGGPAGVDATTTVTIFGFIAVSNIIINDGGTGFPRTGARLIADPSDLGGRDAKFNLIADESGTIVSVSLIQAGTGYSSTPDFIIDGRGGGTGEDITIENIQGNVRSITVTNSGSNTNYQDNLATVSISPTGGATAEVGDILGGLSAINVTNSGQNYTTASVGIGGDGTGATATANIGSITANENILQEDIEITSNMVSPGGGGILRVYFTFQFAADASSVIGVFNDDVLKGNFNADNNSQVTDNGYYRFDIDVESGDKINFKSSVAIDSVDFIRTHLVQFGA